MSLSTGGATELVTRSDTGTKRTAVDREIAGEVGAGPITGTRSSRSSNGTSTRLLAEVTVVVAARKRTVEAKIADRSDMAYSVRLGRDVLGETMVDVGSRAEDRGDGRGPLRPSLFRRFQAAYRL